LTSRVKKLKNADETASCGETWKKKREIGNVNLKD
jgi:hypothetical protein